MSFGNPITAEIKAKLEEWYGQGLSAVAMSERLAAEGHAAPSSQAIGGYLRKRFGDRRARGPAVPVTGEGADAVPSLADVPEGADVSTLNLVRKRAERVMKAAEKSGNLAGVGNMGRLIVQIDAEIRKATPKPKEDPNDDPDLIALGPKAAEMLHKLVDQVVTP